VPVAAHPVNRPRSKECIEANALTAGGFLKGLIPAIFAGTSAEIAGGIDPNGFICSKAGS